MIYTVSFNTDGVSAIAPAEVSTGGMPTPPANDPTKDASGSTTYFFGGWYTVSKTTGHTGKTEFKFTTPITADLTLYARWYTQQPANLGNLQTLIANTVNNANLNHIDARRVTDMSQLFVGNATFNADISDWDVSKVENMSLMFGGARAFNQPLNKWNVSSVGDMSGMFRSASAFNQNIDAWNVDASVPKFRMFDGSPLANNLPTWAC